MTHDPPSLQGVAFRYTDSGGDLACVRCGLPPEIICRAVNGGAQGKEVNPAIPESATEVADAAHAAYRNGALWHCSGIGPHQLPMTTLALLMGGHVRIGRPSTIHHDPDQ